MKVTRTLGTVTVAASLLLAAVACGSSDTPSPSTDAAESSDQSAPASASSSGVPANWKVASAVHAQLHVPPGWKVEDSTGDQMVNVVAPLDEVGISPGFGNLLTGPNGAGDDSTDRVEYWGDTVEDSLKHELTTLKRQPNETFGGSVFYHIQGETGGTWQDVYGTVTPGGEDRATVHWRFNKTDIDRKGADALIAQVMKTYEPTP